MNKFQEKPKGDTNWINGGFFVFNKDIFDYIEDDNSILEKKPLENLAKNAQLSAFKHDGFWYAMDTLREKKYLEKLYESGNIPWKTW